MRVAGKRDLSLLSHVLLSIILDTFHPVLTYGGVILMRSPLLRSFALCLVGSVTPDIPAYNTRQNQSIILEWSNI